MSVSRISLFWTRGNGFISRRIQSVDWTVWQGQRYPSAVNHVGIKIDCSCGDSWASESHLGPGVQIIPWDHVERAEWMGKVEWIHVEPIPLSDKDREEVWSRCKAATGEPYDVLRILQYWVSVRLTGRRWASAAAGPLERRAKSCNEHVVGVFHALHPAISADHRHWTPEPLFQLIVGKPSMVVFGTSKG